MKKIVVLLVAVLAALTLVACSNDKITDDSKKDLFSATTKESPYTLEELKQATMNDKIVDPKKDYEFTNLNFVTNGKGKVTQVTFDIYAESNIFVKLIIEWGYDAVRKINNYDTTDLIEIAGGTTRKVTLTKEYSWEDASKEFQEFKIGFGFYRKATDTRPTSGETWERIENESGLSYGIKVFNLKYEGSLKK